MPLGLQAQITGHIYEAGGSVVPGANVLLKKASDSTLVKAALGEADGSYRLSGLSEGHYFIEAHLIGFEDGRTEKFLFKGEPRVFDLRLQTAQTTLSEVEVSGRKPMIQVESGKTVFNVEKALASAADNTLDLMRRAPGLMLDQNNQVILDGQSGVQIFLDGKPLGLVGDDLAGFLRNLQAAQVEKIEIISQPGARYQAEGTGGIINIVMKRDLSEGTNGSLTGNFIQGFFPRYTGAVVLNHQQGRFSSMLNYSANHSKSRRFMNFNRRQNAISFNQKSDLNALNRGHNLQAQSAYQWGKNQRLGFSGRGTLTDRSVQSFSETPIIPDSTGSVEQVLISNSFDQEDNYSFYSNLYYRLERESGFYLGLDVDHGGFGSESEIAQPNTFYNGNEVVLFERNYRMETQRKIRLSSAQADLAFPFWQGTLGSGARLSLVHTENDFNFYQEKDSLFALSPGRSNLFDYTERVAAGYLEFSREWEYWSLQTGFRYEHTYSLGDLITVNNRGDSLVERNYGNWFPSFSLSFQPSRIHKWSFDYSERILRPNYQNLNPFRQQIDQLSYREGNPFLLPQTTSSVKLSHVYRFKYTSSLSFSETRNFYAQVTDTAGVAASFITTRNVANQRNLSLSLGAPLQLFKWWNLYLSLNAFQNWFIARDPSFLPLERFTVNFYGQSSFDLGQKWQVQISGFVNSPSVWGGTYRVKTLGALNVSVRKNLLQDRLSISLDFNDILFTNPWRAVSNYGALEVSGRGGHDSRQLRLSVNYKFGNRKLDKMPLKKGVSEEMERVD